jgi:hypothetical protein
LKFNIETLIENGTITYRVEGDKLIVSFDVDYKLKMLVVPDGTKGPFIEVLSSNPLVFLVHQ